MQPHRDTFRHVAPNRLRHTSMSDEAIQQIAARCLVDEEFARAVLAGEGPAEVREAIVADLYSGQGEDVQGFGGTLFHEMIHGAQPPGSEIEFPTLGSWQSLPRPELTRLATRPR